MSNSIFRQITNIKDRVRELLIQHPLLRDDDYKLIATYYFYEGGGKNYFDTATAYDFLKSFSDGNYTSPESIRRVRAKLQEEDSNLRGLSYKRRKDDGDEFRQQINK
jgi:hypothetical protein